MSKTVAEMVLSPPKDFTCTCVLIAKLIESDLFAEDTVSGSILYTYLFCDVWFEYRSETS